MADNGTSNSKTDYAGVLLGVLRDVTSSIGNPRASTPDLHDPAMDATGRVDVLVARSLKRVVDQIHDPVLRVVYAQFQPIIDSRIADSLGKLKIKGTLKSMGLGYSKPVSPRPKRSRPRRRKGEVL